MPVISHAEVPGTLSVELGGALIDQHRGKERYTFVDGRFVDVHLRAANSAAYLQLSIDTVARVEAQQQIVDAEKESEQDIELVSGGEASRKQKAVAKIRKATVMENRAKALALFQRIIAYIAVVGINFPDVFAHLDGVLGFQSREWNAAKTRYQWLNANSSTVAAEAVFDAADPLNA